MRGEHLRWSYLSTAMTVGLQLLSAVTLTRFLQPKDYGLAALALVSSNLTAYFTQLGVGRALVQKPAVTEDNIRAAFTLSLLTGLTGLLVLSVSAPMIASALHNGQLIRIVRIFGLNLLFQALSLVSGGLLRRALRMRALALCDVIAYALSTFGLGLPLAMHGYGVWALVASTVSQSLIQCTGYFIVQPHAVRLLLKRSAFEGIASFSSKASITTAIEAIGNSIDMALIGRLLGAESTGIYNRSLTLSTQPCYQFSMGLTRVFVPTLAHTLRASDQESAVAAVVHAERQLMSIVFPLCVAAIVCAPVIVPVVLGQQWVSAVPAYQLLCIVAAFDSSFDIPALQLEIMGQFRAKLWLQSIFALLFFCAILVIAPRAGVSGVAAVYGVLQAVRSIIFHRLSAHSLGISSAALLQSWLPGLLCSVSVGAVLFMAQRAFVQYTSITSGLAAVAFAALTLLTILLTYYYTARETVFREWKEIISPIRGGKRLHSAAVINEGNASCVL